jgi:hypothetical protein
LLLSALSNIIPATVAIPKTATQLLRGIFFVLLLLGDVDMILDFFGILGILQLSEGGRDWRKENDRV